MKKKLFFEKNAWTIAHKNYEKGAFFEQNGWTIAHQNHEKEAFFRKKCMDYSAQKL